MYEVYDMWLIDFISITSIDCCEVVVSRLKTASTYSIEKRGYMGRALINFKVKWWIKLVRTEYCLMCGSGGVKSNLFLCLLLWKILHG